MQQEREELVRWGCREGRSIGILQLHEHIHICYRNPLRFVAFQLSLVIFHDSRYCLYPGHIVC